MRISNPSAFHDYTISERFEAGVKLSGPEVKSVKGNHASLKGAFVRILGTEAFLVNAHIYPYEFAVLIGYDPRRSRKLLLHKKEIIRLKSTLDQGGMALIPIALYLKHGLVKLEVGMGRGRKEYEKREILKKREDERKLQQMMRNKG